MVEKRKKLYVIDAFGLIYRSYFAFINRPLRDNDGKKCVGSFWILFDSAKDY